MSDKVSEVACNILFVLAIGVSLCVFGLAYSFWVSFAFIIYLYWQRSLKRILSSGICVLAPFVLSSAKASILSNYEYETLIGFINRLFNTYRVDYSITKDVVDTLLVYLLLSVVATLFFREDKTAIGKVSSGGSPEFKEKTFIERQDDFCKSYSQRIESINRQHNWNNALYVPIETEVELTRGHKIRRYEDILKCIKKNKNKTPVLIKYIVKRIRKSRLCKVRIVNKCITVLENEIGDNTVYLVLGDPGSGKSVSLRKLCSELLNETHVTGKMPVYISLQTWLPETGEWSENNLPTKIDLLNYIKKELYKDGDLFTHSFLNDYFELMMKDGRFYFIFDSFDEMPCLMGGENNSKLIQHMSELIHDFLTGPNQNGGIIASRLYNRPSDFLDQTYTLRLQRFDNSRILKMLKRYLTVDVDDIVLKLFKERIDLVELCRNPFHLSLLIDYIKNNKQAFPDNQFELFKDFLEGRLEESNTQIIKEGFSQKEIYEAAINLSVMMQKDRNYGLDFPINRLDISCKMFDKEGWDKCIAVLTYAKICRTGGNHQTVSFVHRRFQEFFYVEAIINGDEIVTRKDCTGILDNTGMRDALVLYCQIAQKESLNSIIDFCCDTIEDGIENIKAELTESSIRLLNALYFLIEAFSNRKEVLQEKQEIIVGLREYLKKDTHYMIQMAIVNSITLINVDDIQQMIIDVFRLHNRWLNTIMVSKCQLIKKLNRRTEISFCQFLERTFITDLIKNYAIIDFSLSLSECFAYVRRIHMLLPGVCILKLVLFTWFLGNMFPALKLGIVFIIQFFKERLSNMDGPMNRIAFFNLRGVLREFDSIYVRQPVTTIRHIMELNLCLLLFVVMIIMVSDMMLELTEGNLNINCSRLNIPRIQMKLLKRSFLAVLFPNNYSKRMYSSIKKLPIPYFDVLILPISVFYAIYFFPSGPMLFLICFFQFALTGYYVYRLIHEVIMPLYNNWYSAFNILKIVFKILPMIVLSIVLVDAQALLVTGFMLGGLFYGIPVLTCLLLGLDLSKENIVTMGAVLMLIMMLTVIIIVIWLVIRDIFILLRSKMKIDKIGREELVENIKKMNFRFARSRYVDRLMHNDVKLYGIWPENYNTSIKDDVIIRRLAIWDCKELPLDNIYEDIM